LNFNGFQKFKFQFFIKSSTKWPQIYNCVQKIKAFKARTSHAKYLSLKVFSMWEQSICVLFYILSTSRLFHYHLKKWKLNDRTRKKNINQQPQFFLNTSDFILLYTCQVLSLNINIRLSEKKKNIKQECMYVRMSVCVCIGKTLTLSVVKQKNLCSSSFYPLVSQIIFLSLISSTRNFFFINNLAQLILVMCWKFVK
jgi:hypothetical protein